MLLLCMVAGGGYYFLHTQLALHLVVNGLRQAAANVLGSELTADGWQGDLLHGLTVTNLSVRAEGRQWLTIRKIKFSFDAFPLLIGLLHVKSLDLVNPDLSLTIDDSGNIVTPMSSSKRSIFQGLGWRGLGRIDHFSISNGAVHWYNKGGEKNSDRDLTDLTMAGKAGFFALPGSRKWSAWLSVSSGSLRVASNNLDIAMTAGRIALHPDRLEGRDLHFSTQHSDVRADLVLPYGSGRPMSLRWREADLSLRELGLDSDKHVISSGSLVSLPSPPELTVARSRTVRHPFPVYKLQQRLRFENRRFSLNGRLARPFSDRFSFEGSLQFTGLGSSVLVGLCEAFKMPSTAKKIQQMQRISNLQGSLFLDTEKTQQARQWHGTLKLRKGILGAVHLSRVVLPFRFEASSSQLQIDKGLIDTDKGRFSGNLSGSFVSDGPLLEAHGKIENYRPAFLPAEVLAGKKLAAAVDLSLDQNGKAVFRGDLEPLQIDGHLLTEGHFAGSSNGKSITLQNLTLATESGKITVSGQKKGDALSAAFNVDHLPLSLLFKERDGTLSGSGTIEKSPGSAYHLSLDLPRVRSGHLQLTDLHIKLPLSEKTQSLDGQFRINAGKGVWRKIHFADLALEGSLRGSSFSIDSVSSRIGQESWRLARPASLILGRHDFSLTDFELASGQSTISVSLQRREQKMNGRIEAARMNISKALSLFGISGPGKILCNMDLTVGGSLSLPSIAFSGKVFGPVAGKKAKMDFEGKVAENQLRLHGIAHVADQAVPMKFQMPMHFSIAPFSLQYDLDRLVAVASLQQGRLADFPILATHGCDGHFQMTMQMGGDNGQPRRLTGRLHLEKAGCRIPDTNLSVEEGDLLFHEENGIIVLEPSTIKSNHGELVLHGEVTGVQKYPAVSGFLSMSSDAISLNYQGSYDVSLAGSLTAEVKKGKRSLKGKLTVLSADLQQPMQAAGFDRSDNTVVYASRSASKGIKRTDFLEELNRDICGTKLDVRINLPKNVSLHAGALSLQLEGALHASNDGNGLGLTGRLVAVGGTYSVAGRVFKVEEGEVTFKREYGLDPAVKGKAVCRMPDLTVIAKVKGTAEKPSVLLESDPWMKENEIESAIVFGKPVTAGSVKGNNQYDTSVAALLGGTVLNKFRAMTGTRTLLDSFNFYSDKQAGSESIAIGKYLTNDLLFSYRQGVEENNAGEVRVEYKLKGGFSLESLYSEEGQKSGFDFYWSKDF